MVTTTGTELFYPGMAVEISGMRGEPRTFVVDALNSATTLTLRSPSWIESIWIAMRSHFRAAWWDLGRIYWEAVLDWEDWR